MYMEAARCDIFVHLKYIEFSKVEDARVSLQPRLI